MMIAWIAEMGMFVCLFASGLPALSAQIAISRHNRIIYHVRAGDNTNT